MYRDSHLTTQRGRDADAIVQRHIKLLHTYNEIKDGAQALIGKVSFDKPTTKSQTNDSTLFSPTRPSPLCTRSSA
jgi:hypothetical protein